MSRFDKWVIEARHPDGVLDFADPQPESVFGLGAIHGLTEDQMAKIIFQRLPESSGVSLQGDRIAQWPSLLDPRWQARPKTW